VSVYETTPGATCAICTYGPVMAGARWMITAARPPELSVQLRLSSCAMAIEGHPTQQRAARASSKTGRPTAIKLCERRGVAALATCLGVFGVGGLFVRVRGLVVRRRLCYRPRVTHHGLLSPDGEAAPLDDNFSLQESASATGTLRSSESGLDVTSATLDEQRGNESWRRPSVGFCDS
jgi:hypothetical protein